MTKEPIYSPRMLHRDPDRSEELLNIVSASLTLFNLMSRSEGKRSKFYF